MGPPLAPVLANLFMGHQEKLWLENFQDSEILFYRRYVQLMIHFVYFILRIKRYDFITTLTLGTLLSDSLRKKK